jgi:hypothetical protein
MPVWAVPPLVKIYEALGCLADGRLEVDGDSAKCYSSSRGKFYTIEFDPATKAIMCNDNASYWVGYLGYPAIAFLMQYGELPHEKKYEEALKGVAWKDVNTKFKNDWDKTADYVEHLAQERGIERKELRQHAEELLRLIKEVQFELLGPKIKPPAGY